MFGFGLALGSEFASSGFGLQGCVETNPKLSTPAVAEKTYHFKELHIETIVRSPKNVGLFGYR